ncbi:hypothetical protein [Pseudomonas reidholzensis]|uniref:hypothetical protein n=1 Tax=Pseudomonas reidholzensis TaxID=1785162 RepID=UPI0011C3B30E|nr:hypothetical protein [Pseudomonas reidholzensis]
MFEKYISVAGLVSLTLGFCAETVCAKDVYVGAYTRSDGTHVQAHYRSAPDGNLGNNWSTLGNINPYTGEPGTLISPSRDTTKPAMANSIEDDGESDPDRDL